MMPYARTKEQRVTQVFNWLCEKYPHTMLPVRLKFVEAFEPDPEEYEKREHYAEIGWNARARKLEIRISRRRLRSNDWGVGVETIIHEYAHALTRWDIRAEALPEHHPDGGWPHWYGVLYADYYDDGGSEESKEFPIEF